MINDEFLSEEDLDLRNLTEEELDSYWNMWLLQAQETNDLDKHTYSHGVFTREPTIEDVEAAGDEELENRATKIREGNAVGESAEKVFDELKRKYL